MLPWTRLQVTSEPQPFIAKPYTQTSGRRIRPVYCKPEKARVVHSLQFLRIQIGYSVAARMNAKESRQGRRPRQIYSRLLKMLNWWGKNVPAYWLWIDACDWRKLLHLGLQKTETKFYFLRALHLKLSKAFCSAINMVYLASSIHFQPVPWGCHCQSPIIDSDWRRRFYYMSDLWRSCVQIPDFHIAQTKQLSRFQRRRTKLLSWFDSELPTWMKSDQLFWISGAAQQCMILWQSGVNVTPPC